MGTAQKNLAELYVSIFSRAPDANGLAYWVNELATGHMTLESINQNWIQGQAEALIRYPDSAADADFIAQIYQNVFGRAPDTNGASYWQAELASGNVSRDVFIAAVINAAKSNTTAQGQLDALRLDNKSTVGLAYANKGINDTDLGAKVVAAVNSDANSLVAAQSLLQVVPDNASTQLLNTLSSTLEHVASLLNSAPTEIVRFATYMAKIVNDIKINTDIGKLLTFIDTAVSKAATDSHALDDAISLGSTAVIDATPSNGGGSGVVPPTFTVTEAVTVTETTFAGTPGTPGFPGISDFPGMPGSGIPAIPATPGTPPYTVTTTVRDVVFGGTATGDIDIAIVDGISTFARGGVTATKTISNIAESVIHLAGNQTLAMSPLDVDAAQGVTITGAGTFKATATLSTHQLSGIAFKLFTGVKDYTVADSVVNLTHTSHSAMVLDHNSVITDASVSLAQIKAVDTANGTGKVGYTTVSDTLANLTDSLNLSKVQDHDSVITDPAVSLAQIAAVDTVNGTGSVSYTSVADTLLNLSTYTGNAPYTVVDTANAILAASSGTTLTGAAAIKLSADATDLSVTDAQTLTDLPNFNIGAYTYSVSDTVDKLLSENTANGNLAGSVLGDASSITANAQSSNSVLDFSSFTHNLVINGALGASSGESITGGSGNDTITGGVGADSIRGGLGADTLTGGAGNDTFFFSMVESTVANMDTITDYRQAGDHDTIVLSGMALGGAVLNAVTDLDVATGLGKIGLAQAIEQVAMRSASAVASAFEYDGDTYVYATGLMGGGMASSANDTLIKLAGVAGTAGQSMGDLLGSPV